MLSLILSIMFWRKTDNRKLGIAAIAVSALATIISFVAYGLLGLVDAGVLAANIIIFLKSQPSGGDFY